MMCALEDSPGSKRGRQIFDHALPASVRARACKAAVKEGPRPQGCPEGRCWKGCARALKRVYCLGTYTHMQGVEEARKEWK